MTQWANRQNTISMDAYNKKRMIMVWDSAGGSSPIEANFGPTGFIEQRAAYFEQRFPG